MNKASSRDNQSILRKRGKNTFRNFEEVFDTFEYRLNTSF